jgi:cation/acetate symporter
MIVAAFKPGEPNTIAIVFFVLFVLLALGITWWAARRTRTTDQFYAAGHSITGFQNGLALSGDYMSAASFLGIAGLVALTGFDGLIYSIGFLVGWPIVLFLIAEPLRNLGRYTFADVVAYRLRQKPVRVATAFGTLSVVVFYLIAQMVGAGTLIHLIFGLPYAVSVVIVGAVMLTFLLLGGMIATTWVQIVKATLLIGGATVMAFLVLLKFDMNPLHLFQSASSQFGASVLEPGSLVSNHWNALSLGLALMFGTAGLPHILMRFYTVPDRQAARTSVNWATFFIGFFYLLTFVLGFGAMALVGQAPIKAVDKGGNAAALLLAENVAGTPFFGFIAAVAFATILAVVAGLTLSGAAALSHDLWVNVVRDGEAPEHEQFRVARAATFLMGGLAIVLGIVLEGQNIAFMVGLAFAIAASANFPALLMSIYWRGYTTWGAVTSIVVGATSALVLISISPTVMVDVLNHDSAIIGLTNPALISMPLAFVSGILVSLLRPEPEAAARFAEAERRIHLGDTAPRPPASGLPARAR